MRQGLLQMLGLLLCFGLSLPAWAGLPAGLLILGYDGVAWHPYIVKAGSDAWSKIEEVSNPVSLSWQVDEGAFLVKGSDGGISRYLLETAEHQRLNLFGEANYTQLRAHQQGVVMVRLTAGTSRETSILDAAGNEMQPAVILQQSSAQFHPVIHNERLYYAHVSCRAECKPLIQEVWSKELQSGHTRQLTLLNATSYLYSVTADDRYGFISSNQRGYYHLARLDLHSGKIDWLTGGKVTDSYPSISPDGDLYFIRRSASGSRLMKLQGALDSSGAAAEQRTEAVALPADVQKIRYLELNHS